MSGHDILQPPGWARPKGYANGISATGRLVFTAGLIGWTGAAGRIRDAGAEHHARGDMPHDPPL